MSGEPREYPCEHIEQDVIDGNCPACAATVAERSNETLRKRLEEAEAERDRLITEALNLNNELYDASQCIAFFKTVIQSGEPWTDVCQEAYDKALGYDKNNEGSDDATTRSA